MKPSALLLATFLLTACASNNDGFVDQRVHTCKGGEEIEIEAGLDMPGAGMENFGSNAMAHVQLSNNSDDDVTVKNIRVDPRLNSGPVDFTIEPGFLEVNAVLPEAESEQYEIPLSLRRSTFAGDPRMTNTRNVTCDLDVTVLLANGESYRCRFRVLIPLTV